MKLLFDANLSYRLVKALEETYPYCLHVTKTGLEVPARDSDIWEWAKNNGFTIVTNDEDFMTLLERNGFPPKVILLRIGNQKTSYIVSLLTKYQEAIQNFHEDEGLGILEIWQGN